MELAEPRRSPDDPGLAPGTRLGNLVVEREIGRGGFAVVHLARDVLVDRPVALKVLPRTHGAADEAARRDLLAEARIVASLHSPDVVTLYGMHELPDGRFAIEMEYLDGGSVHDLVARQGRVGADRTAQIVAGVLRALRAAHRRGVLHGDVKPANVLLGTDGAVKLADFGIARVRDDPLREGPRGVVGSPWYMAPEVLLGEETTQASDVWSVGVLAYEALAGKVPFGGGDVASLFHAVQNAGAPPLPAQVPAPLARLVLRCLAKRAADRASSADELLALLAPSTAAAVSDRTADATAASASFLGRDAELARLDALTSRAAGGRAGVVVVSGETGIGKTALLAEAALRARPHGVLWIQAALSPVDGLVASLAQALRGGLPSAEALAQLDRADGVATRERALAAFAAALRDAAADRAVVLALDDAQNAADADVAFLGDLARRIRDRRTLLAVAERTEAPGAYGRFAATLRDAEHLLLGGLPRETLCMVLESAVRGARLAPQVAARIVEHSDGNPQVATEILGHLETTGALVRREGRLEPVPGRDGAPLPTRLRELFAARVAALSDDDRALLEAAAVDGREFDGRALAAALGLPVIDVLRSLQRLCRTRLVAPTEQGYRFASGVLRTSLHDALAPEIRREYHRALAEHLETRAADVHPERLARHWEALGETERARPHLLRAAVQANRRWEPGRVLDLASRAGLLRDDADLRAFLPHDRLVGSVLAALLLDGRVDDAERLRTRFRAAAEAAGETRKVLHADVSHELARLDARSVDRIDADLLRRAADEFPDSEVAERAHYVLGLAAKRAGRMDEAQERFEKSLAIVRRAGDEVGQSVTLDQLGSVARRRARLEEAGRLYEEAARLAERCGRLASAAVSDMNRVMVAMQRGSLAGIEPVVERAIRTFELEGSAAHAEHARGILAELRLGLGDATGALAALDGTLDSVRRLGRPLAVAQAQCLRAEALVLLGRFDEAAEAVAEGRRAALETGDRGLAVVAWGVDAYVQCARGRRDEGAAAARALLAVVADSQLDPLDAVERVAGAALFGLPPAVVADAAALAASDRAHASDPARAELLAKILAAVAALHVPDAAAAALRDGAAALRDPRAGARPAAARYAASWLHAEALRREGDTVAAVAEATATLREASAAGNVLFAAALQRFLDEADASGAYARRSGRISQSFGERPTLRRFDR